MKSEDPSQKKTSVESTDTQDAQPDENSARNAEAPVEIGGRKDGLDPTRYGDWEKNGRCIDF
jgi:hypothetical protein